MSVYAAHYKQPESVLVVIHTPQLDVLLLERADFPGYWQSITGSLEPNETPQHAAQRELFEESGLDAARDGQLCDAHHQTTYSIYEQWRHRYPPGTTHNTEHLFTFLVPAPCAVTLSPREHRQSLWLPWQEAAEKVFSPSNKNAILALRK
ncbi:MAG: dihydroneopterin triphosphate diphosphatase [Burkholderiales bacterium]|jgi:dATP pyrophosphohydrolase|nr:dihydroneopterin triphosphate diphosphatase [Burkholderiales bacterium]